MSHCPSSESALVLASWKDHDGGGDGGSYLGTIAGALVLTEINTLLIGLGFKPPAVQAAFGVIILVLVSLYARVRHLRSTM